MLHGTNTTAERFVFGTPRKDLVYGRTVRDDGTTIVWLQVSEHIVRSIANRDDLDGISDINLDTGSKQMLLQHAEEIDWRSTAVDLHVRTPLTQREADVYVLQRWFGLGRNEIATTLEIAPNTADNHLQRIRDIEDEMTQLVLDTVDALGLTDTVLSELVDGDH